MSQGHGTSLSWIEGLLYDLRFASRGLWRDRAFASAAIATLALAIALNASAFTVMQAMLFGAIRWSKTTTDWYTFRSACPPRRG